MVLRYEEIEQTNAQVTMTLKTRAFEEKGFKMLKIYRNRSLGEFVPIFSTPKTKYTKAEQGVTFSDIHMPIKDICRNDRDRMLRFEIYKITKRGGQQYLGCAEMSVLSMINSKTGIFNVYIGKSLRGEIHVAEIKEWNKYAFIDYIYGGMTVSLLVAIDFTLGNKNWSQADSLHYISEEIKENPEESLDEDEIKKSMTKT